MTANVQVTVAENLYPGRAAGGSSSKLNRAAVTSVQAAVGDQCGVARVTGILEYRFGPECAADRAAIVDEGGVATGARVNYSESCILVGKGAIATSWNISNNWIVATKYYEASRVDEGAIACGRAVLENDQSIIGEGGIACSRGVDEIHLAIVGEGGIVRSGGAPESYGAIIGEGS